MKRTSYRLRHHRKTARRSAQRTVLQLETLQERSAPTELLFGFLASPWLAAGPTYFGDELSDPWGVELSSRAEARQDDSWTKIAVVSDDERGAGLRPATSSATQPAAEIDAAPQPIPIHPFDGQQFFVTLQTDLLADPFADPFNPRRPEAAGAGGPEMPSADAPGAALASDPGGGGGGGGGDAAGGGGGAGSGVDVPTLDSGAGGATTVPPSGGAPANPGSGGPPGPAGGGVLSGPSPASRPSFTQNFGSAAPAGLNASLANHGTMSVRFDVNRGQTAVVQANVGARDRPGLPPPAVSADSATGAVGLGASALSAFPVRYWDGLVILGRNDLASGGFGTPWGHSRSWYNLEAYGHNAFNGAGWVNTQAPYLRQDLDPATVLVINGHDVGHYDDVGGAYVPRFFRKEQLAYDGTAQEFILTDAAGNRLRFHDFNGSLPAAQQGTFKSLTDPSGNVTQVTSRNADGKVLELQRSHSAGGTTVTESYVYTYVTSGGNAGMISNVTLRRQTNGGAWSTVRQVDYVYYDGVEAHGPLGNLKTVNVKDSASNVLDTEYYRYYVTGEANGFAGGLKYAFFPDAYARLVAAVGSNIAAATDAQVAPYANHYFEYDAQRRVTKEVAAAAGCGCGGGQGTFIFSYTASGNPADVNNWDVKTIETLPDGNEHIVYTDAYNGVLLKVFKDVASGQEWPTYYRYRSDGQIMYKAAPSAVTGYSEAYADLLDFQLGASSFLRDDAGLYTTLTYGTSTTATATAAGTVTAYLDQIALRRGELGTVVPQERLRYFSRTSSGVTIYPLADTAVYRNSDGTGAQTTAYGYVWQGTTFRPESVTVTFATISTGQNGPGTADTETTQFNSYGYPLWSKDGDGFLRYSAFDVTTGAVTKHITDVDSTRTADFTGLPAGWSTPAGGGLHLITQVEVDNLGRATKLTEPAGNVTYTVYKDTNYEVRIYPGWDSSINLPTGPTQVLRLDRPGSYAEALTMSATPTVAGGRPTGAEALTGLETLSRRYTNASGQVTHTDGYFVLAGLVYSTALNLGTENTHFYRTRYAYDDRGRLNKVTLPTGTIYKSNYDAPSASARAGAPAAGAAIGPAPATPTWYRPPATATTTVPSATAT